MSFFAFYFKESPTYLSAAKEPNSLVHDDKDSGDDNPNSPYSLMIDLWLSSSQKCIYHFEYPQRFRNIYFYLQQFVLGDHKLVCAPQVINSYHESIQSYLNFANSLWVE